MDTLVRFSSTRSAAVVCSQNVVTLRVTFSCSLGQPVHLRSWSVYQIIIVKPTDGFSKRAEMAVSRGKLKTTVFHGRHTCTGVIPQKDRGRLIREKNPYVVKKVPFICTYTVRRRFRTKSFNWIPTSHTHTDIRPKSPFETIRYNAVPLYYV